MLNILFVCLGNICRSPIAEATFRELVEERGLSGQIRCDSAGTHRYHLGDLPDPRTRRNAESHGLRLTHRCRCLSVEDFARFDYFVGMDEANLRNLRATAQRATGTEPPADRVFLLRKFDPLVPPGPVPAVPDPYYEEDGVFEEVYQVVRRSGERFLNFLVQKHGLRTREIVPSH